jgi:hypothetical protein
MNTPTHYLVPALFLGIFLLIFFSGCVQNNPAAHDYHVHANFAVYIDGQRVDFAQPAYMSEEDSNHVLAKYVHLHDGNGSIIHIHAQNIRLKDFFTSLGIDFNSDCIAFGQRMHCVDTSSIGAYCSFDANTHFCTQPDPDAGKSLQLYVNGKINSQGGEYVPRDLDRILITYGKQTPAEIQQELDSVPDDACIPSGKCPERGSPPDESSCTTAGGCSVDLNALADDRHCVEIPAIGSICW